MNTLQQFLTEELPVNLEGLPDDELQSLNGTLGYAIKQLDTLQQMARLTLTARMHRKAGRISSALIVEANADKAYKTLDPFLKW